MSERKKNISGIKGIEKKNSFSVPEGYFDSLNNRIQDEIQQDKDLSKYTNRIFGLSWSRFALAASFTGLILIAYSVTHYIRENQRNLKQSEIEIADVINYQVDDIDDNMIYEFYAESTLRETDDESSDEKILNAMVEYLVTSDIDIQLIAQEL